MRPSLAVLLPGLLFGCGDKSSTTSDAAVDASSDAASDASSDAAIDAAPTFTVTVRATRGGQPAAGATVVVNDADGTYVSTTTTDATGVAMPALHAGGMVTVVDGEQAGDVRLTTIVGPEAGEELAFELTANPDTTEVGTVSIQTNTAPLGQFFGFRSRCFYASPVGGVAVGTLTPGCFDASNTFDVFGTAWTAGEQLGAWTFTPDLPSTTTSLTPTWSTSFSTASFGFTNVPAAQQAGYFQIDAGLGETWYPLHIENFAFTTGDASVSRPYPRTATDKLHIESALYGGGTDASVTSKWSIVGPATETATASMFDLATDPFPLVTSITLSTTTTPRPSFTWQRDANVTGLDALVLVVDISRSIDINWSVVLPPDAPTTFMLPALPGSMPYLPTPADEVDGNVYPTALLVDVSVVDGPAGFRAASAWVSRLRGITSVPWSDHVARWSTATVSGGD